MKFTEKNSFLVRHTSGEHFSSDMELFKVHCPNSRLHIDLKRENSFNRKKLDGLMLWELLEKVSPEEILKNREKTAGEATVKPEKSELENNPESNEKEEDEKLNALEDRIKALEESNDFNEDEISGLQSELEDKDTSIEELQEKIESLEKKAFNKKKASRKNSQQ
jgi:uncharacterized coiled-coil protein SlyX